MVSIPAGTGSEDALAASAFGVLALLKDNLAGKGYTLSIQDEDEVVIKALTQHGGHLSIIGIQQDHLDPFKLVCWLGKALISHLEAGDGDSQREVIIDGLIETLDELLFLETDENALVAAEDKELLKRMLVAEMTNQCDHGIGFNGLYIAFHFARGAVKSLTARNLIKKAKDTNGVKPDRANKPYAT
jgi:hypothetical protein